MAELESPFYRRFVCVIVQYTTSLNNEKLIKVLKAYQNDNCVEKAPRKGFHFRLANEEESAKLSGYRHNAVTPFMFRTPMTFVVSDRIGTLEPRYFWLGGGHENLKLRLLSRSCA